MFDINELERDYENVTSMFRNIPKDTTIIRFQGMLTDKEFEGLTGNSNIKCQCLSLMPAKRGNGVRREQAPIAVPSPTPGNSLSTPYYMFEHHHSDICAKPEADDKKRTVSLPNSLRWKAVDETVGRNC